MQIKTFRFVDIVNSFHIFTQQGQDQWLLQQICQRLLEKLVRPHISPIISLLSFIMVSARNISTKLDSYAALVRVNISMIGRPVLDYYLEPNKNLAFE